MQSTNQPEQRELAVRRFTERVTKLDGFVDEAELEVLREAGIPQNQAKKIARSQAETAESASAHARQTRVIRRFTEHVFETGVVDEAERKTLRREGIPEGEIGKLARQAIIHSGPVDKLDGCHS